MWKVLVKGTEVIREERECCCDVTQREARQVGTCTNNLDRDKRDVAIVLALNLLRLFLSPAQSYEDVGILRASATEQW